VPDIPDLNRFPVDKSCPPAWEKFVGRCRACANAGMYSLESCRSFEGRAVVAKSDPDCSQIPAQEIASAIESAVMHATELRARGVNVKLLRQATWPRGAPEIADNDAGKSL
jgi:hypothetical protein